MSNEKKSIMIQNGMEWKGSTAYFCGEKTKYLFSAIA